eukprot:3420092-Pyramimonas_sp.AAC.1
MAFFGSTGYPPRYSQRVGSTQQKDARRFAMPSKSKPTPLGTGLDPPKIVLGGESADPRGVCDIPYTQTTPTRQGSRRLPPRPHHAPAPQPHESS